MGTILKEELFKNGFVSFNLKSFDENLYNKLKVFFPKRNLKPEMFNHLKNSIIGIENEYPNSVLMEKPFLELEKIKYSILEKYEYTCDQLWFFDWPYDAKAEKSPYTEIIKPLFKYFYDEECEGANSQVTMYNDGCYLKNHTDGNGGYTGDRHCAILIYLSTEYEKGKGGEMVLSKNKTDEVWVEPIYGNVAIFDFTKHDIWHRVEKVIGYNRYCFINFC
jgi:Rps23 Pro-64 3,4-dihydroxylase Tpa1-like proline 4-hydroxylase